LKVRTNRERSWKESGLADGVRRLAYLRAIDSSELTAGPIFRRLGGRADLRCGSRCQSVAL